MASERNVQITFNKTEVVRICINGKYAKKIKHYIVGSIIINRGL